MFVYCIQKAGDIAILLSQSSSCIILFFEIQTPVSNSEGNTGSWAQNTWGWEKFAIFD